MDAGPIGVAGRAGRRFSSAWSRWFFRRRLLARCSASKIGVARRTTRGPDGATRQYDLYYYGPDWQAFEQALTWLKANARSDDIVITSAPYWTWLWTGLKAVQPAYEADSAEEQRQLETVGATYLVLDAFSSLRHRREPALCRPGGAGAPGGVGTRVHDSGPPGASLSPSPLNVEQPALIKTSCTRRGM